MSKKTTLVTIVIAVLLLAAVAAIALNAPAKKTGTANSNNTQTTESETSEASETPEATTSEPTATIVYTDDGFEPEEVTIKAGDTVRIENKSSLSLSFNSDDHPSHTDISELNVNDVPEGGSRDFVVTKAGTWGFHNHDNASHEGKIIVQ